jgi:hypothetical protein
VHADIVRRKRSERNGRIGVTSSSPSSVSWTSSLPTEVLTTGSFLCARITSIQGGRFEPVSVVVVQEWVWESSAVVCPMAFEPPVVEGPPVVMVTAWVCVVPERTSVMELFPILAAVYRMVTMFVDIHVFPVCGLLLQPFLCMVQRYHIVQDISRRFMGKNRRNPAISSSPNPSTPVQDTKS